MYGYIRQGQRTGLTREVIGGVPFWVLTAGRGWQRLRVRSLLRRLARHGVRTAVFEGDAWQTAAARYGIHPVPVGALRLAKLEELLDCLCPALSGKTVRLCVGKDGGTARQAAQVLAKRARYIELTPPGQTALAQWLLARDLPYIWGQTVRHGRRCGTRRRGWHRGRCRSSYWRRCWRQTDGRHLKFMWYRWCPALDRRGETHYNAT